MISHRVIDPARVEAILAEDGVKVEKRSRIAGAKAPIERRSVGMLNSRDTVLLISEDQYNEVAAWTSGEMVEVESGHAVFVVPYKAIGVDFFEKGDTKGDTIETSIAGRDASFIVDYQISGGIVSAMLEGADLLVVDSIEYGQWIANVNPDDMLVVHGYELKNWESTAATVKRIRAEIEPKYRRSFVSRVEPYLEQKQRLSLTLFVGLFVSFLFFIAAGSMIYFKLFTELQDDQIQYRALRKIGVTAREMRRIISTQIGLIFFVPVIVGTVHAAFAMKALGNILVASVWKYEWLWSASSYSSRQSTS